MNPQTTTPVDVRAFLIEWLRETTPLDDALQYLFQDSSLTTPAKLPAARPFMTYRMGSLRPQVQGGDMEVTMVQTAYLQVHTDPGDFGDVDAWLNDWVFRLGGPESIDTLTPAIRKKYPFITHASLDYISEDLRENDWNTIFRQLRLFLYIRNPYSYQEGNPYG